MTHCLESTRERVWETNWESGGSDSIMERCGGWLTTCWTGCRKHHGNREGEGLKEAVVQGQCRRQTFFFLFFLLYEGGADTYTRWPQSKVQISSWKQISKTAPLNNQKQYTLSRHEIADKRFSTQHQKHKTRTEHSASTHTHSSKPDAFFFNHVSLSDTNKQNERVRLKTDSWRKWRVWVFPPTSGAEALHLLPLNSDQFNVRTRQHHYKTLR